MPKYFKKLLFFSTPLVLLPVVLWGVYSYYHSSSTIIEKYSIQNKQALYRSQYKVEQLLESLDHSVTQFMISSTFRYANQALGTLEFVKIRELRDGMQQFMLNSLGVEGFTLLNLEHNWMITDEGFRVMSPSDLDEFLENYISLPNSSQWLMEDRGDHKNLRLVKKTPLLTNLEIPRGLMILEVNIAKLNDLLLQEINYVDLHIFDQDNRRIVSSRADEEFSNEIISLINRQEIPNGGEVINHIRTKNEIIDYHQSNYNNWLYVANFSVDAATNDLKKMGKFIILFCSLILLLMGIYIVVGTRKMYSPIRKIYELSKNETHSNLETSKNEFLYIERRIDTLLKAQSMLNVQLTNQSKNLTDSFILKLLLGLVQPHELKTQELISQHSWKWLAVISLQIDSVEIKGYSEKDQNLILFAMDNITSELVPPSQCLGTMIIDQTQVTILIGKHEQKDEFKSYVNRLSSIIQNSIFNYLKIDISIGVGGVYQEIQGVSKSYKDSLQALNYRFRLGSNVILHLDEVIGRTSKDFEYPHELEDQLIHSIKIMDYSESKTVLKNFFEEVRKRVVAYEEYQFITLHLFFSITRMVYDQGKSILDITGKDTSIYHLLSLYSDEEICGWMYDSVIEPVIKHLEDSKYNQTLNLSEQITQIIHNEYETDLTLDYCAAQVNFHRSYVSRVFKKEMGCTFSEYLSNYRLKMAEKWLIETDMNISEMAERFNYSSSAAFIRYFRNIKGITPGEFRKTHQEN